MRCQYCGNEMREGALFCSQCGNRAVSQAAPVKKICPNCGEEGAPDMLFCEYCGTRLTEKRMPEQPTPRPVPTPQPVPVPEPVPTPQPVPAPRGRFLMELNLMSYYKGEPTLGIAKATGTVKIYDDRLEFHKKMGNSAASMFGAVGMLAAAKQAKKDGAVDVYRYRDMQSTREGRYGGLYHTIVLVMKDGQTHSFAGTLNSGKIQEAVVQIARNLG